MTQAKTHGNLRKTWSLSRTCFKNTKLAMVKITVRRLPLKRNQVIMTVNLMTMKMMYLLVLSAKIHQSNKK
jgi:hypothetical protein